MRVGISTGLASGSDQHVDYWEARSVLRLTLRSGQERLSCRSIRGNTVQEVAAVRAA